MSYIQIKRSSIGKKLVIGFLPLFFLLFASAAQAATLNVPADHATIQAAINASSSGDTILVAPGTYTEGLNLNGKSIQLIGTGGADVTFVDGNNSIGVLLRANNGENNSTLVEGFTFQNGNGGVSGVIVNSDLTIRDCVVANNEASISGFNQVITSGIAVRGGSPLLERITIHNNLADARGGFDHTVAPGLYVVGSASPTMRDSVIRNNIADGSGFDIQSGVGVMLDSASASLTLDHVLIHSNEDDVFTASDDPDVATVASGVYLRGGTINADYITVAGNTVYTTPPGDVVKAGVIAVSGTMNLTNSIIANNGRGLEGESFINASYSLGPKLTGTGVFTNGARFNSVAGDDFTLACGSNGLDNANPANTATVDLAGNGRPFDSNQDGIPRNDMGVFELQTSYPDSDGDGIMDCVDNCINDVNPTQDDYDSDGAGDACDNDHNPEGADGSETTDEDVPFSSTLTGFDFDGDPLTYQIVFSPNRGTLTSFDASTGDYTYTPDADYNGSDSFRYRVRDNNGNPSALYRINITINPLPDVPVAQDSTFSTPQNTPLIDRALASDGDGDPLFYSVVSQPTNGTLTTFDATTGDFTYAPNVNFTGTDSFTFKANDGTSDSNTATVTIDVFSTNDPPVAMTDVAVTAEDTPVSGTVTATDTDGDPLTYSVVTQPADGTLTAFDTNTGDFTYSPDANFNGVDTFTFRANDGTADSNTATITITVTPVNDAPVANDDTISTAEDTPVSDVLVATDVDGDLLVYTIVSNPTDGVVTIDNPSTGAFTYTPDANFNGVDTFTFRATDALANSNTATVTINVTPANDAPVASDDTISTSEDTPVSDTVTATDADGDALTYSVVTQPANGTLTSFDANTGAYTYAPDTNYNGSDSFTFRANDGTANSNTATITINIGASNDAPVAIDGTLTTGEDTPANDTLTATDADGDTLTYSVVTQPTNGTVTITDATTGAYTYTPNANYNGGDSFTFRVNDGTTNSNTATVTVIVTPVNDAPVAQDATTSTQEDSTVMGTLSATDVDGDTLTYSVASQPSNGTVMVSAAGDYTYTPDANYNGTDSFTFVANDGTTDSNEATVTINVGADNDVPVAQDDTASTQEDVTLTGTLSATDADLDALTYSIVTQPTNGTVMITDATTGDYAYTPNADYNGTDSFTFKANDGLADSNTATITITVTPVNDAPVAQDATASTQEDMATSGTVSATDVDGDTLTYSVVMQPTNGTLTAFDAATGDYTYTPNANYNGADSFTFVANDGTTDSNEATVTINIGAGNDAPVASDDTLTTDEDTPANGTLVATDADGDALTYSIVTQPTNGTVTITDAATGDFTYTPNADYNGSDSFTFIANDGVLDSNEATVDITVNAVEDAPVTQDNTISTTEDVAVSDVLVATDADGDALTYSIVTQPTNGTVSLDDAATGDFTYTPDANYNGADSFTFVANDGTADSNEATITINVGAGNDAPVLADATLTVDEDTAGMTTLMGMDGDGDALTYSIATMPTNGSAVVDATTGVLAYTPNADFNGADTLEVIANDGTTDSNIATVTITVNAVNDAPEFVAPTPMDGVTLMVAVGEELTAQLAAMDVDGDALTYAVADLPAGATFDAATAILSWTPGIDDVGTHPVTLEVSDGQVADQRAITIEVTAPDTDGDGIPDAIEEALGLDPEDVDTDGDTIDDGFEVGDNFDEPVDTDDDGTIDALDDDSDDDGLLDRDEAGDDNLDTDPIDTDADGTPDFRDSNSDDDSVEDAQDNCPLVANDDQADADEDGIGDACADDDDGDGVLDADDNCPRVANADQIDLDEDMIGDACDDEVDTTADGTLTGHGVASCSSVSEHAGPSNLVGAFLLMLGFIGLRRRRRR